MKKMILLLTIILSICVLASCEQETTTLECGDVEATTSITEIDFGENPKENEYMFMLDGKLYVDTGETESRITCGTMDVNFDKVIPMKETPDKDGEANFKSDYNGAQGWEQENRMVSWVDDAWHIFAYNENNLENVTVAVMDNTATTLKLEINNQSSKEIQYGDEYQIFQYDEEIKGWRHADTIIENYGFHMIAYVLDPKSTTTLDIDFEWLYGTLEPGRYRIVKEIMDFRGTGDYTNYWYLAEFIVK